MGLFIENGKGGGYLAEVNSEGMLMVEAVAASPEHHANHIHGKAFTVNFNATPTGAGDCFLYIKNTSEEDMIIEGFGLWLVANEYIDIKVNDTGTPVGGTDIIPVNANPGSGNIADGTFQEGNDITGLSGSSLLYRMYHNSGNGTEYHNFEMDIVLIKNSVLTMYCQTGTTALAGFINLIYHV